MSVSVMAAFSPRFIPYNGPQGHHSGSQRPRQGTAPAPSKAHEFRDLALSAGDVVKRDTSAGDSELVCDRDRSEEHFNLQGAQENPIIIPDDGCDDVSLPSLDGLLSPIRRQHGVATAEDELASEWPHDAAEDKCSGASEWLGGDDCPRGSIALPAEPIPREEMNPKARGDDLSADNEECVEESDEPGPKHELAPCISEERLQHGCQSSSALDIGSSPLSDLPSRASDATCQSPTHTQPLSPKTQRGSARSGGRLDNDNDDKDNQDYWDVERIVGKRRGEDGVEYKVCWARTWERKEDMRCDRLIEAFEQKRRTDKVRIQKESGSAAMMRAHMKRSCPVAEKGGGVGGKRRRVWNI